jgi:predicted anti-sigma-YlaC factor YlaD
MKCRQFEHRLPDWIAERLPAEQSDRMEAHLATCPVCRQMASAERALRRRWQDLPQTPELPSLWPRLAQRIETVPARPRYTLWPALAMGSMVATVCLFGVLLHPHMAAPREVTSVVTGVSVSADDTQIVQMASQVQQLSEGESDEFFAQTQQDRRELRHALNGTKEN